MLAFRKPHIISTPSIATTLIACLLVASLLYLPGGRGETEGTEGPWFPIDVTASRPDTSRSCDSSRRCLLLQVSATPAGLVIYLPAYSTSISEATRTGVALKRYAERAIPVDRITSWPVEIGLVCRHHVLMIWSPELLGDLKRNEKVTRQLPGNIGCPPGIHVMIMTDR